MGESGSNQKQKNPQSKQLIYRDLSERVTRLTKTPSDLWQELQGMGSSQIMKRHMWNRSMNNAQNTDVKKQLKVRPIFDPGRNTESRKVKNKQRTLQEKLIVLGRTGKDNNAMLEPLENPIVQTQLAPLFDFADQNLVTIDGPSRN